MHIEAVDKYQFTDRGVKVVIDIDEDYRSFGECVTITLVGYKKNKEIFSKVWRRKSHFEYRHLRLINAYLDRRGIARVRMRALGP